MEEKQIIPTEPISDPNDVSEQQVNQKSGLGVKVFVCLSVLFLIFMGFGGYYVWTRKSDQNIVSKNMINDENKTNNNAQKNDIELTKPDDRPLGSLPYGYVSFVDIGNDWIEKGISGQKNNLREFVSVDECYDVFINDLGSLNTDVETFAAEFYQIPSIPTNSKALYKTQYKIEDSESITIGPMGFGEISNTVIGHKGRVIGVSVNLDGSASSEKCVLPETSIQNLIESVRFDASAKE